MPCHAMITHRIRPQDLRAQTCFTRQYDWEQAAHEHLTVATRHAHTHWQPNEPTAPRSRHVHVNAHKTCSTNESTNRASHRHCMWFDGSAIAARRSECRMTCSTCPGTMNHATSAKLAPMRMSCRRADRRSMQHNHIAEAESNWLQFADLRKCTSARLPTSRCRCAALSQ